VVVDEEPVPDELVPEDGVIVELEAVPDVDCAELAVVVVDDGCEVAAPEANVPTPSPSPSVPAVTPATKASL